MRRSDAGRIFAGLIVTFLLAPVATSADAASPQKLSTNHVDFDTTLVDCNGFSVVDHIVADFTLTRYVDKTGATYRFTLRVKGTDTVFSTAGGSSYTSPNALTFTQDYRTGRSWESGIDFSATVPGYGSVLIDAGVVKIDDTTFTYHGPHAVDPSAYSKLCEAFA